MTEHPWRWGGEIKTDPEELRNTEWEQEDVDHVEEALREIHANNPGMLSMPGLEHVRNMIAARVDAEIYPQGHFKR